MATMTPVSSSSTSTIILVAGAEGILQTPSSVNDFCWPPTKSNPRVASGTLMMVPLALEFMRGPLQSHSNGRLAYIFHRVQSRTHFARQNAERLRTTDEENGYDCTSFRLRG